MCVSLSKDLFAPMWLLHFMHIGLFAAIKHRLSKTALFSCIYAAVNEQMHNPLTMSGYYPSSTYSHFPLLGQSCSRVSFGYNIVNVKFYTTNYAN